MNPDRARTILALACTASPNRDERVAATLILFALQRQHRYPSWWAWTPHLAAGITIARMRAALP